MNDAKWPLGRSVMHVFVGMVVAVPSTVRADYWTNPYAYDSGEWYVTYGNWAETDDPYVQYSYKRIISHVTAIQAEGFDPIDNPISTGGTYFGDLPTFNYADEGEEINIAFCGGDITVWGEHLALRNDLSGVDVMASDSYSVPIYCTSQ